MSDSVDRVFIHALQTVRKLPKTGASRPPPQDRLRLYGLYKQSMEGDVLSIMPRPVLPEPISPSLNGQRSLSQESTLLASPTSATPPSPPNGPLLKGELEKWDAWHACAGMTRTEAKKKYIDYLIDTMKQYASGTREGKELVEELEFVWDQIRNNSTSPIGSGSSDGTGNHTQGSRPAFGEMSLNSTVHSYNSRQGRSGVPAGQFRRNMNIGTDGSARPLRVLSPMSREDGGDISGREEETDERSGRGVIDDEDDGDPATTEDAASSLDRRKADPRKWQKRMESAMSRLTVEIAALREQMSDSRVFPPRRRNGWIPSTWSWFKWFIWLAIRQTLFNLAVLGCALLWGRFKGNRWLEDQVRRYLAVLRTRLKTILVERRFFAF